MDRRVGHVCWGWRGGGGGEGSTDDGEPAGTAGRPIVAAIEAADVVDAVVVVVRAPHPSIYASYELGLSNIRNTLVCSYHMLFFPFEISLYLTTGLLSLGYRTPTLIRRNGSTEAPTLEREVLHVHTVRPRWPRGVAAVRREMKQTEEGRREKGGQSILLFSPLAVLQICLFMNVILSLLILTSAHRTPSSPLHLKVLRQECVWR